MKTKNVFVWLVVAVLTVGTVLQPLLPAVFAPGLIAARLVFLPALFVLLFFGFVELVALTAFAVLVLGLMLLHAAQVDSTSIQTYLSIVAIPACFVGGCKVMSKPWAKSLWSALLLTALGLNLLTIVIYGSALAGGGVANDIFSLVQREGEDPLFRFAMGNAIEIPALLAVATVASAMALNVGTPWVAFALCINFISAGISQSRLVLVLAATTLIRYLPRIHPMATAGILILLIGGIASYPDAIVDNFESITQRFMGDDSGSAKDRVHIASLVFELCDASCLAFGSGVGSSLLAMQNAGEGQRTFESVFLQLIFEIGLCGCALLVGTIALALRGRKLKYHFSPEIGLIFLQVMLLLPVFTFTPLYAFLAGAVLVSRRQPSRQSAALRGDRLSVG
jgi:hypothetical protein